MDDNSASDDGLALGESRRHAIPDDLPKSLDDRRRPVADIVTETEIYDGWQGQSQFLTSPMLDKTLQFEPLGLPSGNNSAQEDRERTNRLISVSSHPDDEARLMKMIESQAAHSVSLGYGDVNAVVRDNTCQEQDKRQLLQKALNMAASNGDEHLLSTILAGEALRFVDVNALDEDGSPPIIYASCFGHEAVVRALISAGADVNKQDKHQWSALMWAMANRHKAIAKLLLDNGASTDTKTLTGRTAFDFIAPDSDISSFLHGHGYFIGAGSGMDDFYHPAMSQDKFEEEMAENELRRRMMMESARDLEVDLGNVGMDDQPEPVDDLDDQQDFDWSRCLNDQMFVFQEDELDRILDIIITSMTPQRSPSQKPVPANMIFLSARYAHYHGSSDLLARLLLSAMDKINDVVERHQWDMTILAFWISNATLLLHYLKKDLGLLQATGEFQAHLIELVNEIFILIVRDAERRLDKVLDVAMLEHETIPGFEDIAFQNEWKLFKRKPIVKQLPLEKRFRPPSPNQRAKPAPRNVTSLLSSTVFVLDLYDIHSVITSQIVSQLLYWIGAELFNRIMSNRKYMARTKAMQIRMNVSMLEDWARSNNRQAEHYHNGAMTAVGETTIDSARYHLAPVIQLLQWLQCLSSLEQDDVEGLETTLQQLPRLSPNQLLHAAAHYRPEVGEPMMPKSAVRYIQTSYQMSREKHGPAMESSPVLGRNAADNHATGSTSPARDKANSFETDNSGELLLDPAIMLPFVLPTTTDMVISYGAGIGGMNRDQARKYIPTVPPEFLSRLEVGGQRRPMFAEKDWENEEV